MANLFDYLDWRGDVPFSVDPFNEVDNLLLAELAYTDFDGIVTDNPAEELTISEVTRRYFSIHTEEEIQARKTFVKLAPLLLPKMAASVRFGTAKVMYYVNNIIEENDEQMSAITFLLDDGTIYAAFRGTDNTIVGWKEDFNFGYKLQTAGQQHAAEYLNRHFPGCERPLRVGGHSKGGNFAVYAASFCDPAIQERITHVYSNDGPGFMEEITYDPGYERILPRIISTIPEASVFGLLMHNRFPNQIIKSSQKGIMQHDALSWEIMRNHFVETESITEASQLLERTLSSWIENLDAAQRKEFIDTAFGLASASGAETFDELTGDIGQSYEAIRKGLKEMDDARKAVLTDTVAALIRSGRDVLMRNSIEKRDEMIQNLRNTWKEITQRG